NLERLNQHTTQPVLQDILETNTMQQEQDYHIILQTNNSKVNLQLKHQNQLQNHNTPTKSLQAHKNQNNHHQHGKQKVHRLQKNTLYRHSLQDMKRQDLHHHRHQNQDLQLQVRLMAHCLQA